MKMKSIRKNMSILLVLLALAGLSGCAVVAAGMAGGGTYVYVSGWGKKVYNVDLDVAYNASVDACQSLGLKIQSRERHLADASIKALDGDSEVWIDLESENPRVTEIAVRVGYLGDKVASERVLARIEKEL
ncbi:DUF3568 family protein [Desulfovibrio ferrophilus]|uniref:DUF3568 family protein n=1 Tax=Desulfovibrio ferrophilus TaxID=241368 RepID=A0A2Z6AVR8_9BACT|nr:DUF3568 family protein [Desulfovibrio ferrophilus]BBD07334.1 uncharacterized protein DFE_0608 [Desulfovibrio ferrophilus]